MAQKKGIAEETARVLRERILSGTYEPGTRLPPERELAPELGTNRATLREALRTLGAQGLVHARQGSGIEVLDYSNCTDLALLPEIMRHQDRANQRTMLSDLLHFRRLVAGEVVSLAAERRTEEVVGRLRLLLARQRGNQGDLFATLRTDIEIYETLVVASHSLVNRLAFNALTGVIAQLLEQFPELIHVQDDYLAAMTKIIRAVDQGHAEEARTTLLELLRRSDLHILGAIGPETGDR